MLLDLRRAPSLPPSAEVFLDFPYPRAQVTPVLSFRTTWLASSLAALRTQGLLERYRAVLPVAFHDAVFGAVAGQWAAIQVAEAHYAACDRLELDRALLRVIGTDVNRRVHGTVLSTLLKLARTGGITPWAVLGQLQRLWERTWSGGGVRVLRVGPKDAIVEVAGFPIAGSRYVQRALPFVMESMLQGFCRKVRGETLDRLTTDDSLALHASWV